MALPLRWLLDPPTETHMALQSEWSVSRFVRHTYIQWMAQNQWAVMQISATHFAQNLSYQIQHIRSLWWCDGVLRCVFFCAFLATSINGVIPLYIVSKLHSKFTVFGCHIFLETSSMTDRLLASFDPSLLTHTALLLPPVCVLTDITFHPKTSSTPIRLTLNPHITSEFLWEPIMSEQGPRWRQPSHDVIDTLKYNFN